MCAYACKGNQLDLLKKLRYLGVPWDEFCFIFAAQRGHLEIIKYLHENGCKVDEYAVAAAAKGGYYDCVTYLVSNCRIMVYTDVAFLSAIAGGNTDIVWYLRQNGYHSQHTSDFVAWYGCNSEMLECLLSLRYTMGFIEAVIATYYGNNELVISLYEKGVCRNGFLYFMADLVRNEAIKKYVRRQNPLVDLLHISFLERMRLRGMIWLIEKNTKIWAWVRVYLLMEKKKINPQYYYGY